MWTGAVIGDYMLHLLHRSMGIITAVQSPRHSASSGVLPDLLPPHTPPQSRSPQNLGQRPQDKTTSDEVKIINPSIEPLGYFEINRA